MGASLLANDGIREQARSYASSATVYGDPASVPIREDFPRSARTQPLPIWEEEWEHIPCDAYALGARRDRIRDAAAGPAVPRQV